MTKAEVFLWMELKGKKICGCKFRRQFGVLSYVVDNYCPKIKLAIEIDGATHITDEEIENDKIRQVKLESYGITFLRFTNEEVYDDRYNVVEKIKSIVREKLGEENV